MHQFIAKHATGKKVILSVILTNIIYAVMVFVTIPAVSNHANEMKILDMMPSGYDFAYVSDLFEKLGEDGRSIYLYQQIPLDLVYPFLFALSNFLLLAYLFKKMEVQNPKAYNLCLIPVAAGIFDYFENFGTINLLLSYPEISSAAIQINNIFTLLKSAFVTLFFIVLIISLLLLAYKKLGARSA